MGVQLKAETQQIVDQLLDGKNDEKRMEAVQSLAASPDRPAVESYLIDSLKTEANVWKRTWTLTALAKINLPAGKKTILDHIDQTTEKAFWARHFAILNAASFDPFPQAEIERARQDEDPLVRATAFRALLANGADQYADELLKMLDNKNNPQDQWAACRALRQRPEMAALRSSIEERFLEPLIRIAANPYIWADARWDAVQALKTVSHHRAEAAKALGEMLIKNKDESEAFHRRYCLEGIRSLKQPDVSEEALLRALEDDDAEIRVRAANTLKELIEVDKVIQLIVTRALNDGQQAIRQLVDALRQVDLERAARSLSRALLSPEPKIAERAARLLEDLGGQEAARMLQAQRNQALKTYTELLKQTDDDVMKQFTDLMRQAKIGFRMSMVMHGIVFAIGIIVLGASLFLVFKAGLDTAQRWIGAGGGASALATLLITFYRNPLRNVSASVTNLMKVDVLFLGYVRQLNQIDATFKHLFLGGNGFGANEMKATVEQIQASVKDTLEGVKGHLVGK
jgi:HEAT repeat protein